MGTIATQVRQIDVRTGRNTIMSIAEMMAEHPGHEDNIRITLQMAETIKMGNVIYHVIKGHPYINLLGKSIMFELKDGEYIQMKVQGIMFGEKLFGSDTEGLPILIGFDEIDSYFYPGMGVNPF